jgi:hypothetical protein
VVHKGGEEVPFLQSPGMKGDIDIEIGIAVCGEDFPDGLSFRWVSEDQVKKISDFVVYDLREVFVELCILLVLDAVLDCLAEEGFTHPSCHLWEDECSGEGQLGLLVYVTQVTDVDALLVH